MLEAALPPAAEQPPPLIRSGGCAQPGLHELEAVLERVAVPHHHAQVGAGAEQLVEIGGHVPPAGSEFALKRQHQALEGRHPLGGVAVVGVGRVLAPERRPRNVVCPLRERGMLLGVRPDVRGPRLEAAPGVVGQVVPERASEGVQRHAALGGEVEAEFPHALLQPARPVTPPGRPPGRVDRRPDAIRQLSPGGQCMRRHMSSIATHERAGTASAPSVGTRGDRPTGVRGYSAGTRRRRGRRHGRLSAPPP